MENLGLCTEVTTDDCSKKEKEKGTRGHEHTHTLDPIPFSSLLTLCITWVSGSAFIPSCSSHGGGGLTKTSLGLLESHGAFPESNCEQQRQEQHSERASCEEVGSVENSPRKWQRWEGEKLHGGLKMQWGEGQVFLQDRGDQLCMD